MNPARPEHVAFADREGHVFESRDGGESGSQTAQAPPVRPVLVLPK